MIDAKMNGTGLGRDESALPSELASANGANGTHASNGGNGSAPAASADGLAVSSLDGGLAISNLAFAEELYFQFLRDPGSVEPAWRAYFQGLEGGNGAPRTPAA